MQRRKFLIGAAGTAIGGSALVGSGAFTSVEAGRNVEVNVVGDADAYLGLSPVEESPNAEYVGGDAEEGTVELDFTETETGGDGFNPNATTTIDDLLQVTNQGTENDVGIWFQLYEGTPAFDDPGEPLVDEDVAEAITLTTEIDDEEINLEEEAAVVDSGEGFVVDLEIDTEEIDLGSFEGEIQIKARGDDAAENFWPQNNDWL